MLLSLVWIFVLLSISTRISGLKESNRLDCVLIENTISKEECLLRGCIWQESTQPRTPWCFLNRTEVGYETVPKTAHVRPNGFDHQLMLKSNSYRSTPFEQLYKLNLSVTYVTERIVRFKIQDANHQRYEVPVQKHFDLLSYNSCANCEHRKYQVSLNPGSFNLTISRTNSSTKLIDTSIGGLLFGDKFIQFATNLPSSDVYGFGENYHLSFRHELHYKTYPIFTRDQALGNVEGNSYGAHPFYMVMEDEGQAHGVLLLNSNAMAYTLMPEPALSWKTTGGILDFFVFVGDSPEQVVQLYTSLIGRPTMPPFWSLGFQLCRYGYRNSQHVQKVIQRTYAHNVPLDVHYLDIDYMDAYKDFTYDSVNFANISQYVNETRSKNGLRWTLILDPAIQADQTNYRAFTEGYKQDVFIKWPSHSVNWQENHPPNVPMDKNVLYGRVWPKGPAAFPDFFKNATKQWWKDMIHELHQQISFDALWIDMNEPSNFDSNYLHCPFDEYRIKLPQLKFYDYLDKKTICMNAVQGEDQQYRHYDVHSLYGWSESGSTQLGVYESTGKRGFVVSRSTYPSSSKYATHWLGDNFSTWEQLRQSIVGMLEFSLFGFSFTGSDICGFNGNATAELCRRWYQLGAYYPFSRSHNGIRSSDQDPGYWTEIGHSEVTQAAVNSYRTRYQLLHYLYTRLYRSHVFGETLARPVMHEFSTDLQARSIDQQFMLGSSILVSPFLFENQTSVSAYVPDDKWFKLNSTFVSYIHVTEDRHYTIEDSESHRPLLLRGGSILPVVSEQKLPTPLNTDNLRKVPIELWVLPKADTIDGITRAKGDLFYDDGDSIETIEQGNYNYYAFVWANSSLTITAQHFGYQMPPNSEEILLVENVKIALDGSTNWNTKHVVLNGTIPLAYSIQSDFIVINTKPHLDLLRNPGSISIELHN